MRVHALNTASNPDYTKLEAWKSYAQFEEQKNEPARVQMVYERAIQRYCLVPDLWMSYTTYLVRPCLSTPLVIVSLWPYLSAQCAIPGAHAEGRS
jgi:hypothetical protein